MVNTWGMLMRFFTATLGLCLLLGTTVVMADLEPWKDYDQSEAVWTVTTNEVAKKLGQIEEYHIFRSELPQSGDFNLMLVVKNKSSADLAPNKARYDAFTKEFGKAKADEVTQYSQKNYPAMREITGEYYLREITLKK